MAANASEAPAVDRLLSLRDVRTALGYSEKSVRRMVADGRLPTVRLTEGGRLRFRRRDLEKLMNEVITGERGGRRAASPKRLSGRSRMLCLAATCAATR